MKYQAIRDPERAGPRSRGCRHVAVIAQNLAQKQAQLDGTRGPFKGGQRQELSAEIAQFRQAHTQRTAEYQRAAAHVRPDAPPRWSADHRDPATLARDEARELAAARVRDDQTAERDHSRADWPGRQADTAPSWR